MLVVNDRLKIPLEEFEWSFVASGGPGGQNVNKVASKAMLRWPIVASASLPEYIKERFVRLHKSRITVEGELVLSSQRFRDQDKNRQDCLDKLTQMLLQAATLPKPRKATKPTKSSQRRRVADKRHQSNIKASRKKVSGED